MIQLYLTERNLRTLLNKLNRPGSARTIVKNDVKHPHFPNSHSDIHVTAVSDAEYYTDRPPGEVHAADDPGVRCVGP